MQDITASEIQGLGVGALLLCATIAAPRIDAFISSFQRQSLGMCKRCGDLKVIACNKCKGGGVIRGDLFFGFNPPSTAISTKSKKYPACESCRGRGYFGCPECAKSPVL